MYGRQVDGGTLTFGVSGKLILNNLVMFDDQTDSEWSQAYGRSISGPKEGAVLDLIPSRLMAWEAWKELYTQTLVLDKQGLYRVDTYDSYYTDSRSGILGRLVQDDRLAAKEFVLGLEVGTAKRAYPYAELIESPIANDRLGDEDVVVIYDATAGAAVAWRRTIDGRLLTFERAEDAGDEGLLMRDAETGSVWAASGGEAVSGSLAGSRLTQLAATPSFWFAWIDLFPDTSVYEG